MSSSELYLVAFSVFPSAAFSRSPPSAVNILTLHSCSVVQRVVLKCMWKAEVSKLLSSNEKGRHYLMLYFIVDCYFKNYFKNCCILISYVKDISQKCYFFRMKLVYKNFQR